jgi:hypothetical protein
LKIELQITVLPEYEDGLAVIISDPKTRLYPETNLLCHTQRKKNVACDGLSILLFGCDHFKELKPNFFALTIELTPGYQQVQH